MGLSARLPLAADRYGACVRTVIIRGLDLTGVTMRAQVRLRPDTPGAPLIDLTMGSTLNAEGLYLVSAVADPTYGAISTVQIRINETTLEALPYSGEVGDVSTFAWDWQATISGDKRRLAYGDFVVLPGVTGADNAPADRPIGYAAKTSGATTWSTATLTFGAETVEITIDGADALGPLVAQAQASSAAAVQAAQTAVVASATAESAAGPTYASVAVGLAATADGESFAVDNGDGTVTIYLNSGGAAVAQRTLATTDALAAAESGKGIDLIGRPSVAELLASTAPARGVGAKWYASSGGVLFAYTEAPGGATDQHVTTAGGVKLYVQPTERGYDVRAFGAKDDWDGSTGTNNFAAFEAAYALPRPVTLRLPLSPGGTGSYMLDGATAQTDATGITLDPDPGVSLHIDGTDSPPTFITGQRAARDLRINYANLRYQETLGPEMRKRVTELGRPGSALDGQLQVPIALDFNDATHWQLGSWPNGLFATAAPTSLAADTVQWGPPPAASFVASTFDVVPGDFIQALVTDATTYLPAIAVFTDSGWVLVRQSQAANPEVLTVSEKVGVAATVETAITDTIAAQTTYRFAKSMLGIVIFDQRSFGLVLNGTMFRRFTTSGNIRRAGWAGGFGTAGNFIVQSPVLFKDKRTFGIKPLKIAGLGDSTYDETVVGQSPFDFMGQSLAGVGGCQVEQLTILAHSGDTSAAQLTALEATDLTGHDLVLIPIGINDIQTGVPVATFVGNISAMIDYCRGFGAEPIVAPPAMFYSRADAQVYGQDGGNTSHSADGSPYRLALMRMLADKRVYCNVGAPEAMGAVVASLLAMKAIDARGDQVLKDNIHETIWAAANIGEGWARAVAAYYTHARLHDYVDGVMAIPLPVDVFTGGVGATSTPQYTVDGRTITLGYYLSTDGVTLSDGTIVGTLPQRLRPRADVFGMLVNLDAALHPIAALSTTSPPFWMIGSDGAVKVYGVAGTPIFIGVSASWKI